MENLFEWLFVNGTKEFDEDDDVSIGECSSLPEFDDVISMLFLLFEIE